MTKQELFNKSKMLPLLPGIYIIKDKSDTIIYIGKAKKLRTRVSQYFRDGVLHDTKVTRMISSAFTFDVIVTQSEFEALVLECSQIKQHKPKYNILLKDDKGYSYIKISKEEYPRISACFASELDNSANYIGPYMSSYAVHELVETTNDVFKLPRCTRRFPQDFGKKRPCLNAHIGKCMALCTGKISKTNYDDIIQSAEKMIKRGQSDIVKQLQEKMLLCAEKMDFERAAIIRDQIKSIEKLSKGQKIIRSEIKEQDVLAFAGTAHATCAAILRFRDGRLVDKKEFVFYDTQDIEMLREEFLPQYYLNENEEIPRSIAVDALLPDAENLEQLFSETKGIKVKIVNPKRGDVLQLIEMAKTNAIERLARESGRFAKEQKILDEAANLMGLENIPKIIESYDISNWGDGTSVAGMVVFNDGKPFKKGYRRFKMKEVLGTDDYKSMQETLQRRIAEFEKENPSGQFAIKPDLILLDGGKGQVSVVKKIMKNTSFSDVPIFGMIKDDKHRTRGLINSDGAEISLAMHKGVFAFITQIQDETHRFANDYRKRMQKCKTYSSTLQKIEGVGPASVKIMMAHFKTINAIKNASEEEIANVKGINKNIAKAVYEYYNNLT